MRKRTVYAPSEAGIGDLIIALGQIAREQGYDAQIRDIEFKQEELDIGPDIPPFYKTLLLITVEAE